jgi:tripartite-type tricarboxylate transporter receptor subunit TctC
MLIRLIAWLAIVPALWLGLHGAAAQTYPNRVVRIVVPFAAGAPDSVARILAQQLQIQLGQSVVVENRPAANGVIGTDAVAKAAPDGYTLLISSTAIVVNPSIYRNLPYNLLADLEPVASITRNDGYFLVVNPSVPVKTARELIDYARQPNSKLSYGSPGIGNTLHLTMELFKGRTGLDIAHVPYRGAGPAINDLLGGQIQAMFVTSPLTLGHIQAGKLRPLAFTGPKRWPVLPEVPTMAEAGIADFVVDGGWYGLFAPAKTPPEIVARLHGEVSAALKAPEVRNSYGKLGLDAFEMPQPRFKAFVAEQVRMFADMVKVAKIEPQ